MTERKCDFEGCTRTHAARGCCMGHLQQLYRGKELTPIRDTVQQPAGVPKGYHYCTECESFKKIEEFYSLPNGKPRSKCKVCQYRLKKERERAA